tara:strand:+ start:1873 stop:2142 length:270 start_codon:yes stop_codon:yes gene_type:complete
MVAIFDKATLYVHKVKWVMSQTILIGYVRRSTEGTDIKISINTKAFAEAETYETSDGESYVPMKINLSALQRVIDGFRAVTTIVQEGDI